MRSLASREASDRNERIRWPRRKCERDLRKDKLEYCRRVLWQAVLCRQQSGRKERRRNEEDASLSNLLVDGDDLDVTKQAIRIG